MTKMHCKIQPIEMAGTPNRRVKNKMNVSDSPKWLGCVKRIIKQRLGGISNCLPIIGTNHGTTKRTDEIQNHHRRSVLNRVSAIERSMQANDSSSATALAVGVERGENVIEPKVSTRKWEGRFAGAPC